MGKVRWMNWLEIPGDGHGGEVWLCGSSVIPALLSELKKSPHLSLWMKITRNLVYTNNMVCQCCCMSIKIESSRLCCQKTDLCNGQRRRNEQIPQDGKTYWKSMELKALLWLAVWCDACCDTQHSTSFCNPKWDYWKIITHLTRVQEIDK